MANPTIEASKQNYIEGYWILVRGNVHLEDIVNMKEANVGFHRTNTSGHIRSDRARYIS